MLRKARAALPAELRLHDLTPLEMRRHLCRAETPAVQLEWPWSAGASLSDAIRSPAIQSLDITDWCMDGHGRSVRGRTIPLGFTLRHNMVSSSLATQPLAYAFATNLTTQTLPNFAGEILAGNWTSVEGVAAVAIDRSPELLARNQDR